MTGCNTQRNLQECSTIPEFRSLWYFSQKELEMNSPSRLDGIDWAKENQLRVSYCSFIQNLGLQLGMPPTTIATAIVFCHRFYLRQSHAKNDWEVEETPCYLDRITSVAYQLKHRKNPASAAQKIQVKEVFLRQKELILVGETLLLATIGFDLNVQHPYKPLLAAVKKLCLPNSVARVAWNFLNDWLRTSLCLQYNPHYIAAGSLYLAAKINNIRLPSDKGHAWWHEFDVLPRQLDEAVQHMMDIMGCKRGVAVPDDAEKARPGPTAVKETQQCNSSESCISSHSGSSPMVDCVFEHGPIQTMQDRRPESFFPNTKNISEWEKLGLKRRNVDSHCCSGVIYNGNVRNASQKIRLDYPRCALTHEVLSGPHQLDMNTDTERIREKRRRLENGNSDASTCNPRQKSWGRHR